MRSVIFSKWFESCIMVMNTLNCSQCAHVDNLRFKYLWLTQTHIVGGIDGKRRKKKQSGRDARGRNACLTWLTPLRVSLERLYGITPRKKGERLSLQSWRISTTPMTSLKRGNGTELGWPFACFISAWSILLCVSLVFLLSVSPLSKPHFVYSRPALTSGNSLNVL